MTQEEINDYNRMCAEFLGFKYKNQAKFWAIYPLDNSSYLRQLGYVRMDNLKFHSDWNWIMKIIEKILDVCLNLDSMEMYYNITDAIPKQHKVMQAINQFLIWYNNENNKR